MELFSISISISLYFSAVRDLQDLELIEVAHYCTSQSDVYQLSSRLGVKDVIAQVTSSFTSGRFHVVPVQLVFDVITREMFTRKLASSCGKFRWNIEKCWVGLLVFQCVIFVSGRVVRREDDQRGSYQYPPGQYIGWVRSLRPPPRT